MLTSLQVITVTPVSTYLPEIMVLAVTLYNIVPQVSFQFCWGRISSCEEEKGNYGCGEEYNIIWKKGKGKYHHLSYNFKATGKNIK